MEPRSPGLDAVLVSPLVGALRLVVAGVALALFLAPVLLLGLGAAALAAVALTGPSTREDYPHDGG